MRRCVGAESCACPDFRGSCDAERPSLVRATRRCVYIPKEQSVADNQAAVNFECHKSARAESGFDPTRAGGGVSQDEADSKRAAYSRAMSQCMESRGYSVN